MTKIILIDASSGWFFTSDKPSELDSVQQPIGLLSLAASAKQKFGNKIEIKVLNRIVDCSDNNEFINILRSFTPDVVGIRGILMTSTVFHELAAITKKTCPAAIVIGGGPYPTSSDQAAADQNLDYIVSGEGEIIFNELLDKIISGEKPADVDGVTWRHDGKLIKNPPGEFIENLDLLPFPDYSLVDFEKYKNFISYPCTRRRQIPIFSSRGCPFQCVYCHSQFGKKLRVRSPENVVSEILNAYKQYGIRDFCFNDDAFGQDSDRAMEIFDRIILSRVKLNLYFINGLRGDMVSRRLIDKMVEAGTIWTSYAIETGSPRLQKYIRKNINLDKLAETIHYSCEKDVLTSCFFMIGFPTETPEEANTTIDYVKQFKKVINAYFNAARPFPGTEMYKMAVKEGFSLDTIRQIDANAFHNIQYVETPLIPAEEYRRIFYRYVNEVLLSKERLNHAISAQRRFFTEEEVLNAYSIFFKRKITNLDKEVLSLAK